VGFEYCVLIVGCWQLRVSIIFIFTLYGVTNPVTEVTKLVTHEESLTLLRSELRRAGPSFVGKAEI
jgi:hypothetical protein